MDLAELEPSNKKVTLAASPQPRRWSGRRGLRAACSSGDEFIQLEVGRSNVPQTVVLEVAKLKQADQTMQDRYQIPVRRSSHFEDVLEAL